MAVKNICFITNGYPSDCKVINAFVETLVNEIVDMDVECTVIAPQSLSKALIYGEKVLSTRFTRKTGRNYLVNVYSPKYLSASVKKLGPINTAWLTLAAYERAVFSVFKKLHAGKNFDAVYGHFIFPAGIVCNKIKQKFGIPAFFAYGENTTYTIDYLGNKKTKELLKDIDGVIAVSSENKRVLIEQDIVPEERIEVFPNSVNKSIFQPKNKKIMRSKLGIDNNAFVVAFVGRFVDVKGPNRLSDAINLLNNNNIYSVFIGDGPLRPNCGNILFCAPLNHSDIPEYLSAADVFVLPTLAEGCCNAIIEAMACGLPIISSNQKFNDDILDNSCSIRIDTSDKIQIAEAIQTLYENPLMKKILSDGALKKADSFNINERAKKILSFINSRVGTN